MATVRRRVARPFLVAPILLAMVVGLPAADTAAESNPFGTIAFRDEATGAFVGIGLDSSNEWGGQFSYAVPSVGLFWPDAPATIERRSDQSTIVRYDGPGRLDRAALIDPVFGLHQRSGQSESASIRLEAQINPDRITATASLWHEGHQYVIVDRRPVPDADVDLEAMLGALEAEDFPALYDHMYSRFRADVSEAEFVAGLEPAFASEGGVADVSVVTRPVYRDGRPGYDMSTAVIDVTTGPAGATATRRADVIMIWESPAWKIVELRLRD